MPRFNSRLLKRENVRSPSIAAFIAHPGDTAAKEATSNRWKRRRRRIHLSSSVCVGSGGMQGGLPPKTQLSSSTLRPPKKTPHAASGIYSREGRTEFAHWNCQKKSCNTFLKTWFGGSFEGIFIRNNSLKHLFWQSNLRFLSLKSSWSKSKEMPPPPPVVNVLRPTRLACCLFLPLEYTYTCWQIAQGQGGASEGRRGEGRKRTLHYCLSS